MTPKPNDLTLTNLRQQIDTFDDLIVLLISKRLAAAKSIAAYKLANQLPLTQPQREINVLRHVKKLAQERGVGQTFIIKLYQQIITECLKQEQAAKSLTETK